MGLRQLLVLKKWAISGILSMESLGYTRRRSKKQTKNASFVIFATQMRYDSISESDGARFFAEEYNSLESSSEEDEFEISSKSETEESETESDEKCNCNGTPVYRKNNNDHETARNRGSRLAELWEGL